MIFSYFSWILAQSSELKQLKEKHKLCSYPETAVEIERLCIVFPFRVGLGHGILTEDSFDEVGKKLRHMEYSVDERSVGDDIKKKFHTQNPDFESKTDCEKVAASEIIRLCRLEYDRGNHVLSDSLIEQAKIMTEKIKMKSKADVDKFIHNLSMSTKFYINLPVLEIDSPRYFFYTVENNEGEKFKTPIFKRVYYVDDSSPSGSPDVITSIVSGSGWYIMIAVLVSIVGSFVLIMIVAKIVKSRKSANRPEEEELL